MLRFSLQSGVGEFGASPKNSPLNSGVSARILGLSPETPDTSPETYLEPGTRLLPTERGLQPLDEVRQQSNTRNQGAHLDMLVPGMGSISGNAQAIQGGNPQGGGDIPVASSTTFSLT